ncbi:FtsX-like permease family protein [Mucilaginibacter sp. 14171R-50]|uniref:ABC transporter permease n=1 Tax=Mucilaginibacter sp. 14171R-50 TaxID=2703789 RepID=UPI00138D26B7|nr:ABC transporter permease [Mucilaginibacter sp. 14171R-50]QHS57280.1 FtsX-like permease family protein [Mucilaginibacter sp. 14171R-50]
MIKNYFKTAWRSLLRNKSYTIINITGLAIGIAACLLIFLVIHFETGFDTYHTKKDRIYRVLNKRTSSEGVKFRSGLPFPIEKDLRIDFPQLPLVTSVINDDGKQLSVKDAAGQIKRFKEDDLYITDAEFFNVFDFTWVTGNKKTALTEPNTVVLTQRMARKFFGNWENAMGKTITYENKTDLKVTGILRDLPVNTDLPVNIAISYATIKQTDYKNNLEDWGSNFGSHNCFVVLPANVSEAQFNKQLVPFIKKHRPDEAKREAFLLQPLTEMHFDTRTGLFNGQVFSKDMIRTLSLIGVFLLVIACVNFINLATAQAVNRSKEVGIRKVLGSKRRQLILQFLSETFIITLFSVLLAIALSEAALPALNRLLEIKLAAGFINDGVIIAFLGAVLIVVTLLSGVYPSMVLSGFNPITALKNKITGVRSNGITLRRALVVVQFGIAQVLVIATLVVISQLNHFKNSPLGFDKDAVVTVSLPGDSVSRLRMAALRNEILQQPNVKSFSYSFTSPSDNTNWGTPITYDNAATETEFRVNLKWADADYFKLYNLKFVAGGPYSQSDTVNAYVVNETLLKNLGVTNPKDAIGKTINIWGDKNLTQKIVGVVKDFNVTSLREQIPPVVMGAWTGQYGIANIKLSPINMQPTLAIIEKLWTKTFPENIYEHKFLDQKIENFYRKESQLSQLYKIFAGIAIFISCLGLYGMVSFMAVQRTKEVGIRKTLGASVANIVYLFSKEFTILILISFVISAPVAWYFMQQWLQGFTYRIHPGVGIFAMSIALSIVIAWVTVGYKAIKAALVNPVKSLKSE